MFCGKCLCQISWGVQDKYSIFRDRRGSRCGCCHLHGNILLGTASDVHLGDASGGVGWPQPFCFWVVCFSVSQTIWTYMELCDWTYLLFELIWYLCYLWACLLCFLLLSACPIFHIRICYQELEKDERSFGFFLLGRTNHQWVKKANRKILYNAFTIVAFFLLPWMLYINRQHQYDVVNKCMSTPKLNQTLSSVVLYIWKLKQIWGLLPLRYHKFQPPMKHT